MPLKKLLACVSVLAFAGMSSCSNNDSGSNNPNPVTVVGLISAGVQAAGNGMKTGSRSVSTHATRLDATSCDVHGYPNGLAQTDPSYPGELTYCFMTVDTGDTVLGGFSTPAFVSCMINQANLAYDGQPHSVTVTSDMATTCGIDTTDLPAGTQVTMTGSAPASFNTNYDHGVIIDLASTIGLTFKIGLKTTGATTGFVTSESWTDGSIGTTAGTLNPSTGDLWYESRVERNNCSTASRCGWNRHTRIHANLTMSGSTPSGLNTLSFGYSNIQFTPAQSSFGGVVVSASGDLTNGIKARLWQNSTASAATDYDTIGNWPETTNTKCYTHDSEVAGTCGTGIGLFSTNTKFLLNATDSHLAVADWLGAITGQTFTDVSLDSDTQY